MHRYAVCRKDRQVPVVSPGVHLTVKLYALKKGLTMVEATYALVRKALIDVDGFHLPAQKP
jgi:hypothetical protein